MLKEKILSRKTGIITYGLTPPKAVNTPEKIKEISHKQIERIKNLDIDGLVIYDLQDEKDRIEDDRPYPFIETIDPLTYSNEYLNALQMPKIVYRCVGKYSKNQFNKLIEGNAQKDMFSVFVGAASRNQKVSIRLSEAYKICMQVNPNLILGGVAIPERHIKNQEEHMRIISKQSNGCKYFISQAVYNVEAAKDFLSDYYYHCKNNGIDMVPIIFTLTPCGSLKTLEFMKWLGISIPKWLENDLINSEDILNKSVSQSKAIFSELMDFSTEKGIPIGCNIESVSVRKVEIEASIQLVRDIKSIIEASVHKSKSNK